MTIWRMRVAWQIPKATNTHTEYVIIFCFSTATMVTRTRLIVVTWQEHCLNCLLLAQTNKQTNRRSNLLPDSALLYVCPLSQLPNVHVPLILCYFRPPQYHAVFYPTISTNNEAHARPLDVGATLAPVSVRFWNTGYPNQENILI